ncbi:MAG: Hsp33 family molecular chaperone HslO [Fervidobacterium sp.]
MGRLIFGTAYEGMLRLSAIDSRDIVDDLRNRHKLGYLPTVVLGRLVTASSLVIPWLSEKEVITFLISSTGPAGNVASQANAKGKVRGYISNTNFELEPNSLGKFDVKNAIGKGELTVVRDIGLRYPYVSKVPIISGEIAEDIAYYYTRSEQLPSAFALGVLMDKNGVVSAGGIAVQILDKNLSYSIVEKIEERLKDFSVSSMMKNNSLEDIVRFVLNTDAILFEEMNVVFGCNCSRQKAFESLKVLDISDIYELIAEAKAEITCKWCGNQYVFEKDELQKIFEDKRKNQ